jgi:hypothetical protein
MRTTAFVTAAALAFFATQALAHHGWGNYDASAPVTVDGTIETSKFENPHAMITIKTADKTWTVILAPTTRMVSRGATAELVAVGKTISAYGYPSKKGDEEMRAERITVDGKTIELR